MNSPTLFRLSTIAIIAIVCTLPAVQAISNLDYSTTYTITVEEDGTALWKIEYRTPLLTDADIAAFENYSASLNSVYLPEFRDLMQRSVAQAAQRTSRDMTVNGFAGNALIQTSPTGKYGVIHYTFNWTKFAKTGNGAFSIGDAFVGGMYLAPGNTLIIRYPEEYNVATAEPTVDLENNGLIWIGPRSFGPGKPAIQLKGMAFPVLTFIGGGLVLAILTFVGLLVYRKKKGLQKRDENPVAEETEDSIATLSKSDLECLEEKIIRILITRNGEQFQSEIVRELGLPKSTISTALNALHQRGIIQKVRKGRENLIRLVTAQE